MTNENAVTPADPAQRNEAPDQPQQDPKQPKEGDFRNVETGVNNPGQFDDNFETEQEDQISEEEARTEDEGRTGKS